MSESELRQRIGEWLDGHIDESKSGLLQQQLRESARARAVFRDFTSLDIALRQLADSGPVTETKTIASAGNSIWHLLPSSLVDWARFALAASLLIVVGAMTYQLGKSRTVAPASEIAARESASKGPAEKTIAGYATLRRVVGIRWSDDGDSYREGDVLPAGVLKFDDGAAEIDFFCGATLVVEGPAEMELESDWTVRLLSGRLRANVPPAARGFVVKAAESEIVDLGTEFALDVGPKNVHVAVIDGEVKLRGGDHDGDHLTAGEGRSLAGTERDDVSFEDLITISDVRNHQESAQRTRFAQFRAYSQQLRSDERLIAYYPITESAAERLIPNAARTGRQLDGILVGSVNHVKGRFGIESTGLEFDRPGARVRTLIDGEFESFTFACWAKIDSLEHRYNALFMGDGYENGEPHWQIRDDGCLMFSVMVDDTQSVQVRSSIDQKIVADAGLHHVYFSEPFWDVSKSGQWFHIAAVYDPGGRRVTQYIDGKKVSSEEIKDKFYVSSLRIGPSEIGNWGQPFRKSPWFAVRNLNGTIDELAIFDAPLSDEEIKSLYEEGKPLGH